MKNTFAKLLHDTRPALRHLLLACVFAAGAFTGGAFGAMQSDAALAAMTPLTDDAMAAVSGQALFVSDKIGPSELVGGLGVGTSTDFTFYRMGLDVNLAMNMNINKLQLGCGGVNDALDNTVCDIDFDYVRFMGRSNTNGGAACSGNNCTTFSTVGSDFTLRRPYIEIAIKNDASATGREIAGIKIGAQAADGYVGVGRRYSTNGATNLEESSGGILACNTAAGTGNGVAGCNSGVNSLSGFLGAELSATFPAKLTWGLLSFNSNLCAGAYPQAECTGFNNNLFADLAGTRIKRLEVKGAKVFGSGIVSILDPAYAWLTADLSNLHGFSLVNTQDFFISFQRESISWPRYSKTPPPANGVDACNTIYPLGVPTRCSSSYAVPTNTGWWMNVPEAKLLNVVGDPVTISGLGAITAALGYPGFRITNADFNIAVPVNCYGQRAFC